MTEGRVSVDSSRRPDIQGLRAVAVLLVVVFHAGLPLPGGFIGVDVFFVISGFVITAMLHREWSATGRVRFGRFYRHRFQRLTPALALMIAVVMVASALILSPLGPQQTAAQTALGAMLLVANFVIAKAPGGYFDDPAETNPLLNTWSLSVEEQFYLVFPAALALAWYLARRRGLLRISPFLVVGGIAVLSLSLAVAGSLGLLFRGSGAILGFYSPIARAWEFAAGALLAMVLARKRPAPPRVMAVSGILGLLLLAIGLSAITEATPFPGPWTLLPVVGTVLLIFAGSNPRAPTTRLLSTRPMVKVGDWSYSIYLWHWPLIVFAALLWPDQPLALLLAAVLSLAPALASYRWVEQPIRNLRQLTRRQATRLIAITMFAPMSAAMAIWIGSTHAWWIPQVQHFHAGFQSDLVGIPEEACRAMPGEDLIRICTWNSEAQGLPIYLVGDSNANHFSAGVVIAALSLQRPVSAVTRGGCPYVDHQYTQEGSTPAENEACRLFVETTSQWLSDQPPGLVILSNSQRWWNDPGLRPVREAEDAHPDSVPMIPSSFLEASFKSTILELQAEGHSVLLVQSMPHFEEAQPWPFPQPYAWNPSRCTLITVALGACKESMPLTYVELDQLQSRQSIERIAVETGARILDPARTFCSGKECRTEVDGFQVYQDGAHITDQASRLLAEAFADAMRKSG